MSHWANPYIGIPYSTLGYDHSGCHCWGLVHLIYRERLGINLPKYDTVTAEMLVDIVRRISADIVLPPWCEVTGQPVKDFDLVLMTARRLPLHVALAVEPNRILHVEKGIAAMCVPVSHPKYASRISGIYRHEALRI